MSRDGAEGDHFLGQALHMTARLRDHIERLDAGAAYAADDLAVVLRAFLYTGQGNNVLSRLQAYTGHRAGDLMVSREPDLSALFSVGSLPTRHHTEPHGARLVPIEKWPGLPVVHIRDKAASTTYTWARLLHTYANKWGGAHLDKSVPKHLRVIDMYAAGSLNLSGYLLRTAAIAVWQAAQEILRAAVRSPHHDELTEEELSGRILSSPGGVDSPPADRLSHGELQWLTYTSEFITFLLYTDGPCRLRICTGGAHTEELELIPPRTTEEPPPLNEVRSMRPAVYSPDDFSLGRRVGVMGRALAPPGPITLPAP